MRLRHLSVRNFRGIRELVWPIPDTRLLCLVGCGDSTKSTVLEAIRRVLHPQWNLAFDDADFHQCRIDDDIVIEALLGDIPDSFRDLGTYGQYLSGWDKAKLETHTEPRDDLEEALHIRLKVAKTLEPEWTVIRGGVDTGVRFGPADRAKAAASLIDNRPDYHLTWGRGSILSQVTENGSLAESLADAARAAKNALDSNRQESLRVFDAVASSAEGTARLLGVRVGAKYQAHLDSSAINVKQGALALHDGVMPLRQLGLGSKRLLSTGLVRVSKDSPHITLFDEIEVGLEPHRIARLVQHLKDDKSGQYFLTTHSPVAVRELGVEDLHVLHHKDGVTFVHATQVPGAASALQGRVRKYAEAFLAPKVLVCEGATEVGIARALDRIWQKSRLPSFAYQGVAPIDAGGALGVLPVAQEIRLLNYDVAVFADSDGDDALTPEQIKQLTTRGISVVVWEDAHCTEGRIFKDIAWEGVMASFELARQTHNDDLSFLNQIQTQFGQGFDRRYQQWKDGADIREALGKAAHVSGWFKAVYRSFDWITRIEPWLTSKELEGKALGRQLKSLRDWVDRE